MSFLNDSVVILFWLGIIATAGLLLTVIISPINDAFQGASIDQRGKDVVQSFDTVTPKIFDWVAVMVFIGLPLITLGIAFVNPIPPFFYWIAFSLVFVFTALGFVVEEMWAGIVSDATISAAAAQMPVMNLVFANYGTYFLLVWFLVATGTYVRFGVLR